MFKVLQFALTLPMHTIKIEKSVKHWVYVNSDNYVIAHKLISLVFKLSFTFAKGFKVPCTEVHIVRMKIKCKK